MKLVIWDIDGTLADVEHRVGFVRNHPKNWAAFEAGIPHDGVLSQTAFLYRQMVQNPNITILLLTGRNESSRAITEKWLTENDLNGYDRLFMKSKSHMKDTDQKEAVLDAVIAEFGHAPCAVFEDRARVVSMWKRRGVFVFNVDQENSDGA
jgi:phosphoglycolate phosphatase-like HAD superfamily hydrolase